MSGVCAFETGFAMREMPDPVAGHAGVDSPRNASIMRAGKGREESGSVTLELHQQSVIREVCARFELGEPISVTDAGGTRNISFIVGTDKGKWVVRRRYAGYCDPERVAFDHAVAHFLAQRGVPILPPRAHADGKGKKTSKHKGDKATTIQASPLIAPHGSSPWIVAYPWLGSAMLRDESLFYGASS